MQRLLQLRAKHVHRLFLDWKIIFQLWLFFPSDVNRRIQFRYQRGAGTFLLRQGNHDKGKAGGRLSVGPTVSRRKLLSIQALVWELSFRRFVHRISAYRLCTKLTILAPHPVTTAANISSLVQFGIVFLLPVGLKFLPKCFVSGHFNSWCRRLLQLVDGLLPKTQVSIWAIIHMILKGEVRQWFFMFNCER